MLRTDLVIVGETLRKRGSMVRMGTKFSIPQFIGSVHVPSLLNLL